MKMPNEMAMWKRVLAFIGFVAASMWILYNVLHSITLDCEPTSGAMSCVHREHRAWMTTDEVRFTAPIADQLTVKRHGKGNNQGDLTISTENGRVEMTWMSAEEAQDAAAALIAETSAGRPYHLETHGPRWWLLLLLLTIPVAASFVIPQRLPIPMPSQLGTATTPVLDKKLKRAERKAREHASREK